MQVLQQICGINVVVYFGPEIFKDANFSARVAILLTAGTGLAQICATFLCARVVDKWGRRYMSFLGLTGMIISLAALGAAFQLTDSYRGILALISVLVYRCMFSISMGPLPYIITAEIFPTSFRAAGVSLCWSMNWATNFLVSQTFLPMVNVLTTSGVFFAYMAVCFVAIAFIRSCVHETCGQTLEQLSNLPEMAAEVKPSAILPARRMTT